MSHTPDNDGWVHLMSERWSVMTHGGRALTAQLADRVADFRFIDRYQTVEGFAPGAGIPAGTPIPRPIAQLAGTLGPEELDRVWAFQIDFSSGGGDNAVRRASWGSIAERAARGHDDSSRPVFLGQAEAMLGWPIYREALGLSEQERYDLTEAIESHREDIRFNISNGDYDDDDAARAKAHVARLEALEQKLA